VGDGLLAIVGEELDAAREQDGCAREMDRGVVGRALDLGLDAPRARTRSMPSATLAAAAEASSIASVRNDSRSKAGVAAASSGSRLSVKAAPALRAAAHASSTSTGSLARAAR
jgi:hypothetical protein